MGPAGARVIPTFPFQRYLSAANDVSLAPNDDVDPNVEGTLMCSIIMGRITEV